MEELILLEVSPEIGVGARLRTWLRGLLIRCSGQMSYSHHSTVRSLSRMGLEPMTLRLIGGCSSWPATDQGADHFFSELTAQTAHGQTFSVEFS